MSSSQSPTTTTRFFSSSTATPSVTATPPVSATPPLKTIGITTTPQQLQSQTNISQENKITTSLNSSNIATATASTISTVAVISGTALLYLRNRNRNRNRNIDEQLEEKLKKNHYIKDENGIEQESIGINFCKKLFGEHTKWVQTSYNANFRRKYAAIGDTYNSTHDIFIQNRPGEYYIFDEITLDWVHEDPELREAIGR